MPADSGVLNSNMTELLPVSIEEETISLMLLSILVSSASLAAVTPSFVLKKTLPNAPWRFGTQWTEKMEEDMELILVIRAKRVMLVKLVMLVIKRNPDSSHRDTNL